MKGTIETAKEKDGKERGNNGIKTEIETNEMTTEESESESGSQNSKEKKMMAERKTKRRKVRLLKKGI